MTQATVYLTVAVTYDLNSELAADMASHLEQATRRAIGDGLLTGETTAEVVTYSVSLTPLDAPVEDADTDALEAHLFQRIMDGDMLLEDIPNRLVRYGLCAPAQFLAEMQERMSSAEAEAEEAADALSTLQPPVDAEICDDAGVTTVPFDASAWFAQASDEAILALHATGWGGGSAADYVALFFEPSNDDVRTVLTMCDSTQGTGREVGFEVTVDEDSALAWLKQHRNGLWARILCEDNGVLLVEAQEEEIRGRWDWLATDGRACDGSFATVQEAAFDAVSTLELEA